MNAEIVNKFVEKLINLTLEEKIVWELTKNPDIRFGYKYIGTTLINNNKFSVGIRAENRDRKYELSDFTSKGLCLYMDDDNSQVRYAFGKYISLENKDKLYRAIISPKSVLTKEEEKKIENWMDSFLKS